MFNFFGKYFYDSKPSFPWLTLLAVLVSIASIFCSLYFVYLVKRMEIINGKFQKFCILPLDKTFESIENKFDTNQVVDSTIKKEITNLIIEVQTYVSCLQKIYPNINIHTIIELTEEFSDNVFNSELVPVIELRGDYLLMKLNIYDELYKYALQSELSLFAKLGIKKFLKSAKNRLWSCF